jgi:hypothetical protein
VSLAADALAVPEAEAVASTPSPGRAMIIAIIVPMNEAVPLGC